MYMYIHVQPHFLTSVLGKSLVWQVYVEPECYITVWLREAVVYVAQVYMYSCLTRFYWGMTLLCSLSVCTHRTPESLITASFEASAITAISTSARLGSPPGVVLRECTDGPQTHNMQQGEPHPLPDHTPLVSREGTPIKAHSPATAARDASRASSRGSSRSSTPVRSRSPVPDQLRTPPRPSPQSHSSPATPHGHGSRSPARPGTPERSRTPDPARALRPSAQKLIPLNLAAALSTEENRESNPSSTGGSNQPPSQPGLTTAREPKPATSTDDKPVRTNAVPPAEKPKGITRKVVRKPGLDSQPLMDYFQASLARESGEVLINVVWGGCSPSSSPGCEIEAGLFLSSEGVYLVEVQDPEKHPKKQLAWDTEKLPIVPLVKSSLLTLSKITVGIFDQSVLIEFMEKGVTKTFMFYPRTYEQMLGLTENLKAILDASDAQHQVTSVQECILNPPDPGKVLFLNPDSSDLQKLKEALVRARVLIQVSNFIAACKTPDTKFGEEVRRLSDDASAKFDIVQYVIVSEVSTDLIPVANGRTHLRPRAIILTNDTLYLCKEESVSWPRVDATAVRPPLPCCVVLDSRPIAKVTEITMCDRAQPITSCSDPVYEFSISFETEDGPSPSKSSPQWRLCVHDRQYIDQFITCLTQLCRDILQNQLSVVHTADPIPGTPTQRSRRSSDALTQSGKGTFFQSEVLLKFISLPNYQRLKYFWKYVAQAQFMKEDESLLSCFGARCAVDHGEYTEIEVCVLASNYAVYLVSDLNNIRRWLDGGGPCSFSRMSLLNKQDSSQARCFYRLWLTEVKELSVGLFYLSVQVTESKSDTSFLVLPQNTSATLSFLSALSSSLNLVNSAEQEELSELLLDYIDLGSTSLSSGKTQNPRRSSRRSIEFNQPLDSDMELLKRMLLKVSPSITKNCSEAECVATLQILCWQVMLLVEEIRIRDSMAVQCHPHLILLTNYGLYICANKAGEQNSPSVFTPQQLEVKKWCHIDLIERIEVQQLAFVRTHTMMVYLRSQRAGSSDSLCLVAQSSELLRYFLDFLALLWHERTSKQLPVHWT